MRWLFAAVLVFLAGSVVQAQNDAAAVEQAAAAYESGDYTEAVRLYETAVSGGTANGNIYYNLGNAYYRSNDLGRALLSYLRAQVFIPRDLDLDHNLRLVRASRIDVQGDERGWVEGLGGVTSGVVTLSELGWGALLGWSAGFGLLAAWILWPERRAALRLLLILAAAAALFVLILFVSRMWISTHRAAAVVVEEQARVMSGPGERYLELFTLHAAAEVRIVESRSGWIRLALPDGRQGWLPQESVEAVYTE
jgi:hypothetical protein